MCVCPEDLQIASEISDKIENYFSNLIQPPKIIYTNAFNSVILETDQVENKLEEVTNPNWQEDIIVNFVNGMVKHQNIDINVHAYPLNYYTRETLPALFKIRNLKKGGHIILGNIVEDELKENVDYLAKLGTEQFHRLIGILPHDKNCFTFYSKSGIIPDEVIENDYCPKCKEFMDRLSNPLDYRQISKLKREIYPNARKRYWEFARLKEAS